MLNKKIEKKTTSSVTWRNLLLTFWIVVPILFYCYLFVFSFVNNTSVTNLIQEIPSLSLTFLLSCLSFIQAYLLRKLTLKENDGALLKIYVSFSLIQQLITINLIGVGLVFLYRKEIHKEVILSQKEVSKISKYEAIIMMGMIGLLSVLVVGLTLAQII